MSVDFAIPAELPRAVVMAATDTEIRAKITEALGEPTLEASKIKKIGDLIRRKIYRTGGGEAAQVPPGLDDKTYEAAVMRLGTEFHASLVRPDQGYLFFYYATKADHTARVYIHLKADPKGEQALSALKVLCKCLRTPGTVEEGLRTSVSIFKICQQVKNLYEGRDNMVVYVASLAAAKALALALAGPLAMYTAEGVPSWVKPVARGIGVATDPEVKFYHDTDLKHGYSYGSHRSEIIARGLIAAAKDGPNFLTMNPAIYLKHVAQKFDEYGINPNRPYKPSKFAHFEPVGDLVDPNGSDDDDFEINSSVSELKDPGGSSSESSSGNKIIDVGNES